MENSLDNKVIFLIFVGVFGVSTFVMFSVLDFQEQEAYTLPGFSIGGTEIPDITCFVKQSTLVVEPKGRVIQIEQSPFLIANPTFSFTSIGGDDQGTEVSGFFVEPKIRCNTGIGADIGDPSDSFFEDQQRACAEPDGRTNDGITCLAPNNVALVIEEVQLRATVLSEDKPLGIKKITYSDAFLTNERSIISGQEQQIGAFWIPTEKILDDLSPGQYNSYQEFRVDGVLKIHFLGFENIKYSIVLDDEDIPTFVQVTVNEDETPDKTNDEIPVPDVDSNNDGTIDNNDNNSGNTSTSSDNPNDSGQLAQQEALDNALEREQDSLQNRLNASGVTEFLACATDSLKGGPLTCLDQGKFAWIWVIVILLILAVVVSIGSKKR